MELDDDQNELLRVASNTRGKGGFASASSVRHLQRALVLEDEMPEVAVFLAITAEEEAATAVFAALRKRGYEGARDLRDTDHTFKAGVFPFIKLLVKSLGASKNGIPLEIGFEPDRKKQANRMLKVRMSLRPFGLPGQFLMPDPPLNLVSIGSGGVKTDYFAEVRKVATEEGINSIHEYMRSLANRRNLMLYASDASIPSVENAEELLALHIEGALINLAAYLLIEPYSKQNLAQEALTTFLKIQRRLEA